MAPEKKGPSLNNYSGNHVSQTGLLAALPASWVPYVQLARLVPPAGLFLIYFPHVFGLLHAAIRLRTSPEEVARAALVLLAGSFFVSNAIHIWNDLIDAPLDAKVTRTKSRPIPRGAVTPFAAFVYTLTQTAGAALLMPLLSPPTIQAALYALPSIIGWIYYPWAKRHTYYPQLVLGFCLAWGIVMGELALDADPLLTKFDASVEVEGDIYRRRAAVISLVIGATMWTMIYDTIYAHQDIEDDKREGIKSIAVLYGTTGTKPLLWRLLVALILSLIACAWFSGLGLSFYTIAVGGSIGALGSLIAFVDLEDEESCWWWFKNGFWLEGGAIVFSLWAEYIVQIL
jgi:4-hydroxybenzoate polyprenyltransferase